MKILLLSPWLPWPPFGGARMRIFETLRYLSRRNQITLLVALRHPQEISETSALHGLCEKIVTAAVSGQTWPVFRRLGLGLLGGMPLIQSFHYDRTLARKVFELTSQDEYDIIHIEFPFLAPYLASVSPRSRAKRVLSMHNIESIRLGRELQFPSSKGRWLAIQWDRFFFESWESRAISQFDGITAVSDLEKDWIQRYVPRATVELVPNGMDTEYFCPTSAALPARRSLAFTGLMDHPPNVDAVAWFCDQILPALRHKCPDLFFEIVGGKPDPKVLELRKMDGVHVTGEVGDIRPYLAGCVALVVPLRSGGGTRLKILQAMAMGRPVISTTLGAEGLEVTPGVDILLADNPDQFVNQISLLLDYPETANHLGKAGRKLVVEKYDWKLCLARLENLYKRLLGVGGIHPTSVVPRRESTLEA